MEPLEPMDPQEWLWCESWCSESSKEKAKTIDMCCLAASQAASQLTHLVCQVDHVEDGEIHMIRYIDSITDKCMNMVQYGAILSDTHNQS